MEMIEKEKGQNQSKINICESMDEEKKDRISLLPDCLLVDIISRLPSTKEAIKTGTLSKRWEHLWTNVPNLIFHHPNNDNLLHPDFFSFVDKTLTQCRHLNLDIFELITRYDIHLESQINNWIRYAVNCNVQDLSLTAWTMNRNLESEFVLHDFFFTNSCFTHLYLKGCVFNPTSSISWNKLMTLNISYANLNEDLIQNILCGSPLLENLELYGCYGFRRIDITSKSVKNFALLGYSDPEDEWHLADIIEINAPYIVSLTIADNLLLWKLSLLNVSSLVQAHLDYTKSGNYDTTHKDEEENMLKGFIQSLGHVKELKIGIFCVKVLSRLEAKGFVFPSNLKVVDVTSPLSSDSDSDSLELGDWSHGDSDENGNSEELLLDDGPESEGDKVD